MSVGWLIIVANDTECFEWTGTREDAVAVQASFAATLAVNNAPLSPLSYASRSAGYLICYGMPKVGDPDLRPSCHGKRRDPVNIETVKLSILWQALRQRTPAVGKSRASSPARPSWCASPVIPT